MIVEGNHYFPLESLRMGYFSESSHRTNCAWKGIAGYFNLTVDGEENPNAAWIYRDPEKAAVDIKDHVAFWHGVRVEG